ncbi:MAG: glycosyltransferase family 4 protein [Saprospirales bacterium]|jgi:glycosyltransferase involved in cell wall biosynthesis|nr:glycosyltransferase family 4 protein [Saprospirales bacterium]MBK8923382.1 glycosyltransferase family 4 protein [Saprospirales bacterium]
MKILLLRNSRIPTKNYDDAERVLWWLGRQLYEMGHEPMFLVKKESACDFGPVFTLDEKQSLSAQIPAEAEVLHFFYRPAAAVFDVDKPYLITNFENSTEAETFDANTVFLSANHAMRHGGEVYVYPGIDYRDYGRVLLDFPRNYFHFLGDAAWRGKNVHGAIDLAARAGTRVHVIGGSRVNFRKGLRITLSPSARFHGVLSRDGRNMMLNGSKGLLFPIIWHEPFGLAVPESLYFGCPVFGTPYGALPELLCRKASTDGRKWTGQVDACFSEFGCLSVKRSELVEAIRHSDAFLPDRCLEYAMDCFSAGRMARDYLQLYEKVLNGKPLHTSAPVMEQAPDNKFLPLEA